MLPGLASRGQWIRKAEEIITLYHPWLEIMVLYGGLLLVQGSCVYNTVSNLNFDLNVSVDLIVLVGLINITVIAACTGGV